MISFDNIEQLLVEAKATHLRVYDRTLANHLIDLNGNDSTDLFNKLVSHKNVFSDYEILTLKVGDDAIVKRNWANCSVWKIKINDSTKNNTVVAQNTTNTGISKDYLDLSIQLERLKLQIEFNDKYKEVEKKNQSSDEDKYIKYLPFVAPLLGIKDEDLFKRFQMMGMMNGAMAGSNQTTSQVQNRLTIEGTADEKEKIVEKIVPSIYNKVDKDKFISVLAAIDNNPEFLNVAYEYLSMMGANNAVAGTNTQLNGSFDINTMSHLLMH